MCRLLTVFVPISLLQLKSVEMNSKRNRTISTSDISYDSHMLKGPDLSYKRHSRNQKSMSRSQLTRFELTCLSWSVVFMVLMLITFDMVAMVSSAFFR